MEIDTKYPDLYAKCQVRIIADAVEEIARLFNRHPERYKDGVKVAGDLRTIARADDAWLRREVREDIALGFMSRPDVESAMNGLIRASRAYAEAGGDQGRDSFRQEVRDTAGDLQSAVDRLSGSIAGAAEDTANWYDRARDVLKNAEVGSSLGVTAKLSVKWPLENGVNIGGGELIVAAFANTESGAGAHDAKKIAASLAAASRAEEILGILSNFDATALPDNRADELAVKATSLGRLKERAQ